VCPGEIRYADAQTGDMRFAGKEGGRADSAIGSVCSSAYVRLYRWGDRGGRDSGQEDRDIGEGEYAMCGS
jgi:hypothetical protein